ncbi:protein FAM72A-like [Lethenteron reissneri]|uniref:protein FAM72A-like n=1 Tax=Lethenteron reissneri TaxID=7753 RepID=UPI002AB6CF34|nr:protein FAM72A-like [Lethenteron reissneri]
MSKPGEFTDRAVLDLRCGFCGRRVSPRGMRAVLLSDPSTHLYSTDAPPTCAVGLVGPLYSPESCACRVQDAACLTCGNALGYHVAVPCRPCLLSCHNGHLWMFHSHTCRATERLDSSGVAVLLWGVLAETDDDDDDRSGGTPGHPRGPQPVAR